MSIHLITYSPTESKNVAWVLERSPRMNVGADFSEMRDAAEPGLRRLQALLDAMPIGVSWAALADRRILYANRDFTRLFGYTLDDLRNVPEWRRNAFPYPEDAEIVESRWGQIWNAEEGAACELEPVEVRIRCKDGSIRTVIHGIKSLPEAGLALATYVDITERKRDEIALHEAERLARENEAAYRLLLDNSPEMTVLASPSGVALYVSPAVQAITGYSPAEFLALPLQELVHAEDAEMLRAAMNEIRPGEPARRFRYRIRQKSGGYRWVEANGGAFADPELRQIAGYVTAVRDISEQKMREDRLATEFHQMSQAASLDELTGIANRRAFNQRFRLEIKRADRPQHEMSLLMLDVDLFKQFNDLYGHLAGDECLRAVASAVRRSTLRESDLVARFGGEEFVVMLPGTNLHGATRVACNIQAAVAALAIPHEGSPHRAVTVSIGVASWSDSTPVDRDRLMTEVDRALYDAKHAGRNTICFSGPPPAAESTSPVK